MADDSNPHERPQYVPTETQEGTPSAAASAAAAAAVASPWRQRDWTTPSRPTTRTSTRPSLSSSTKKQQQQQRSSSAATPISSPEYYDPLGLQPPGVQTPTSSSIWEIDLLKQKVSQQSKMISELIRENVELRTKTRQNSRQTTTTTSSNSRNNNGHDDLHVTPSTTTTTTNNPHLLMEPSFGKEAADFVAELSLLVDLSPTQLGHLATIMDTAQKKKRIHYS